jgi:hypothetical protein
VPLTQSVSPRTQERRVIMPVAALNLIKQFDEHLPKNAMKHVAKNTRGIYALLKKDHNAYNVIYVGMAGGDKSGIHGRLNVQSRSKRKKNAWEHFSIFEVHDNVSREVIQELEGLFRHIYRKDSLSQRFNRQKNFKRFSKVHVPIGDWKDLRDEVSKRRKKSL